MLNALYPDIPWPQIKCVGFDLDGTLYDEFVFICQVYRAILKENSHCFEHIDMAFQYMLDRWLEKGSSYNRIFDETFELFAGEVVAKETFIEGSLEIFRCFEPALELPPRNMHLMRIFKQKFDIFLISDGPPCLQRHKFHSLKLDTIFSADRVIFTGDMGGACYKPNPASFEKLGLEYFPSEILYFGDRSIDLEFSRRLGIHFQKVYNMVPR
jgi:putative hydrolase of the HAD superfamily